MAQSNPSPAAAGSISPLIPVEEQQHALRLFQTGESIRIDAYAGTGKTTTLRLLAGSTSRRGLYLAFNRSIAADARSRFPTQIHCATSHSIAFRSVRRSHRYPEWKLTGSLTPNLVAEAFHMPTRISFASGTELPRLAYASVLIAGLKRFLQSDDQQPELTHFPRIGILETLPSGTFHDLCRQALDHLQSLWVAMQHPESLLPFGHDGYLKLWALSKPQARVDYLMVDEAQDLNPVLLGVLSDLRCPVVYVGDPFQQIYDWRGAVNAMQTVKTQHQVLLSQSFRFGPAIANAATIVIRTIGARHPLLGVQTMESHIAQVRPSAILCRTNAGVIANVLRCLGRNLKCHVLGGTRELERLLEDVQRIKAGVPAQTPELLGFANWKDVMSFGGQPEGEYLHGLVTLVQEYGETRMLNALARCEPDESLADITCCTAHKAKGREWPYVQVDDDFEAAFARTRSGRNSTRSEENLQAETRLLYVAITRAQIGVQLPAGLLHRFGLKQTIDSVVGGVSTVMPEKPSQISPYLPAQPGDSFETLKLRKILRGEI
jgi:hypothetical protein